jgi:predicted metal-dependent phosphoesterase TrpH
VISPGVDLELFHPTKKKQRIVVELVPGEREAARKAIRSLDGLDGWEVVLLRQSAPAGKPYVPHRLRGRVHVRTQPSAEERAALLNEASEFVPAPGGSDRLALEAAASSGAGSPADGFAQVAARLDRLYRRLAGRKRAIHVDSDPLSDREWIAIDLHTHTSWSHDCSVPAAELLETAEEIGLGAIAVTDHNVFGGAQEAVELGRDRRLIVIPGEEVKTKGQGEVIGLFLREEIPRGLTFEDTIAAVRAQGGLVFLPHPFDRRHAIPDPATLHRHLAEIDVLEVYNARLLKETYNDEALRFARKYNLLQGAGSDAHVLPGLGTGAVRMREFRTPEEFLISLHTAEILRRPKSLAYLQSLKWVAQVKEKVR